MGLLGSNRGKVYGNLTAKQAGEYLAKPVLYVLTSFAYIRFPLSSAARPSKFVEFSWCSGTDRFWDGSLPIKVNAEQYQQAVLPVLQDPVNNIQLPINNIPLQLGHPSVLNLIERLEGRLQQSFEAAGF